MSEAMLVQMLTQEGRRFIKGLRYNLPSTRPLAAAVLSDVGPTPIALYVVPPGADQDYTRALDSLIAESPLPAWIWAAGQEQMPPIPDRERTRRTA